MRIFLQVICYCCLASLVQASEETYTIAFKTLGWNRISEKIFYQSPGQTPTTVNIGLRARSESYAYVGPSPLVFFRQDKVLDGSTVRVPVATIGINENNAELLLLFVQAPDKDTLKVFPMNDSFEEFPPGSVRFANMTDQKLGVLYDEETIVLGPLEIKSAEARVERAKVHMAILAIRNEELKTIYNAQWGQDNSSRCIIFIKPTNNRLNGVETRTISEFF